jgi:ribosomal protein S14
LQSYQKNASPVRLHNRCKLTGRPRGYMRQSSRVTFREMANNGLIPGVKSILVRRNFISSDTDLTCLVCTLIFINWFSSMRSFKKTKTAN